MDHAMYPEATRELYRQRHHTVAAMRKGATPQEVMEATWVASEMRAGAAYAHSNIALDAMNREAAERGEARSASHAAS